MKRTDVNIPAILLEGDQPMAASAEADPAEKFATGPQAEIRGKEPEPEKLAEAYGTGRLLLIARDPNSFYAHWDLTDEQQRHWNQKSADGHLVVRLRQEDASGPLAKEVHVHPESRHWFIDTNAPGAKFVAELGFRATNGSWQSVAVSDPAMSPAEAAGQQQQPVRFSTLSFPDASAPETKASVPPSSSPGAVPVPSRPGEKRGQAVPALEPHFPLPPPFPPIDPGESGLGHSVASSTQRPPVISNTTPELLRYINSPPSLASASVPGWTSAQERALAELIGWSFLKQEHLSSEEIAKMIRGEFPRAGVPPPNEVSSIESGAMAASISSAAFGELPAGPKDFWLNINAELVIYGGTEPDARVTIAGQAVALRPDGTFSVRFALPDGSYKLAVSANSAQGDVRRADIDFSRTTAHSPEVVSAPQDPALSPPVAEDLG